MPAPDPSLTSERTGGPRVDAETVIFTVPDPDRGLAGVRLWQDLRIPGELLDFRRSPVGWTLRIPRPPVTRMEYLLEVRRPDGSGETVPDPGNPLRAVGAFGVKSVVEFPGYATPAWLGDDVPPGHRHTLSVAAPELDGTVDAVLWSPSGLDAGTPAPLVAVHDGPEYDALASLVHYLAAGVGSGRLPPIRAALLVPGLRDPRYSANEDYARALACSVLPALTAAVPTSSTIGMGTSLGALAMLHAHRRFPATFDRLFLQSGSFFVPRFDAHESGFPHYSRMITFVAEVLTATSAPRRVPVVLVCGAVEENVHNNRLMTAALQRQGYDAELHEVPDVHNFTAWRDGFDPHLTGLLTRPEETTA